MAKIKTEYACESCGAKTPRWQGQCPECLEWNTISESLNFDTKKKHSQGYTGISKPARKLSEVSTSEYDRIKTDIGEFDRVLGGGIVVGSVTLIGGDPGIGKSSILLQIMTTMSMMMESLYVTGEESLEQIALRAKRMNLPTQNLTVMSQTCIEEIAKQIIKNSPKIVVIDSIQTMKHPDIQSAPGGVSQVRECAAYITQIAKQHNTAIFLVGHVTKSGEVAGPRVLEHIVDAVIFIEGQIDGRFRLMRAMKNRFGAVNEIGIFAMTDKGMKEVKNPSAIFLSRGKKEFAGSVIISVWEGTRPLLVEVQSLVNDNDFGQPRRLAVGIDPNRLIMLIAIAQRHLGIQLQDKDIFINVVGGIKVSETSTDLAIIAVILSSLHNKPIPYDWIIMGEVGLSGEIRPIPYGAERINEAKKHGFKTAIIPRANKNKKEYNEIKVVGVDDLKELFDLLS